MQAQEWRQVVGIGRLYDQQGQKLLNEALRKHALRGDATREMLLNPGGNGNNKLVAGLLSKPRPDIVIIDQGASPLIRPYLWVKLHECGIEVYELQEDSSQEPKIKRLSSNELALRAAFP